MTYYDVIGKETNHSSIFNRSVLDSELSIFDKDQHMNIGKAGKTTISVATTQNMISFIVALILLPFTDMEMRHINFGDKSFSIIADRSEIEYYFSAVFQHGKAQCVNGMLGREIVFAQ